MYIINYYPNRRHKIIKIHIMGMGVHAQNVLLMEHTPKSSGTTADNISLIVGSVSSFVKLGLGLG